MSAPKVALDQAALTDIRDRLKGPRPRPLLLAMLFDYGVLLAVIAAMVWLKGSPWFWALLPLAWIVIATRQHALLVLMHEATHSLAHPVRWVNELWGELLGAPMLVSMRTYRKDHLAHHRHANSDQDPDWARKLDNPSEAKYWQFPVGGNGFGFLLRSWARSIVYLLRSFTHLSSVKQKPGGADIQPDPLAQWIGRTRLALYLSVALLLTVYGGWWAFLLLWLAPILLVLPIIMRLRSIAEHFALPYETELSNTRTILCGPIERFLFGPHGINYHLEHHLLASVSFSQLPQLHEALMRIPAYAEHAQVNGGYLIGPQSLRQDMLLAPAPLAVPRSPSAVAT